MGPMSGIYAKGAFSVDNRKRHEKCREKGSCKGPGCKVRTGKTQAARKPVYVPDRTGVDHLTPKVGGNNG